MKNCALLFFAAVLQYGYVLAADPVSETKALITSVRDKYAPDKRTDIFNVDIDENSMKLTVETTVPDALKEFKAKLTAAKINATVVEKLLPAAELNGQTYGVVNLSVVNNRVTPANQAELATQTLLGTPVKILKRQSGYFYVRTPDNYLSWVSAEGIRTMDEVSYKKYIAAERVVYIDEFGHTYEQPSEKSQHISDIVHGNIIRVEGKVKNFYKVVFPDNRIAYIPVKSTMPYKQWVARPNPNADNILSIGKTLMGVPYLWGGTSIKGMDCSGFTKTCYYLNGIILPRDASQQALVGEKIDVFENDSVSVAKCLQNLKPGDLMFFGSRNGKTSKVTHTGIYMGNGEFIHESGLVRINSMVKGKPNYNNLVETGLVSASRMLNSIGTPGVSRIDQNPYYIGMLK